MAVDVAWPIRNDPFVLALANVGKFEDTPLTLGTMNVQGTASGPLSTNCVLSPVDILGGDILEKMLVNNSWELFSRALGAILTEFNHGTSSRKISFQGFNGQGKVNAVKLLDVTRRPLPIRSLRGYRLGTLNK